jgi:hypothetical protein
MLPHMLSDEESQHLRLAGERQQDLIDRRDDAMVDRAQKKGDTKRLLAAAGAVAGIATLGIQTVNVEREHAHPQPLRTHPNGVLRGYVNSGVDSNGNLIRWDKNGNVQVVPKAEYDQASGNK